MPPLASIEIPVISLSQSSGDKSFSKSKAPARPAYKPRTYGDEPLPTRLSDQAPKGAHIVARESDQYVVSYRIKIGDVELDDIGIDEILDYVSAQDLEEFEHKQFEEEREVLKVLEDEQRRLKKEKLERMKERAKRKGVASFGSAESTNVESESGEVAHGRHGRPRPTYTHLYKKKPPKDRKGLNRESEIDEPVMTSGNGEDVKSSDNEQAVVPISKPLISQAGLPKRRRRKRDKVTGELLPLSPVAQKPADVEKKRQRRRRHPLTGELMPIGWRFDADNEQNGYEQRRYGVSSPAFMKLSISQEHEAKRQRLDTESSVSRSVSPVPTKAEIAARVLQQDSTSPKKGSAVAQAKTEVIELLSSDEEPEAVAAVKANATLKPLPKDTPSKSVMNRVLQSTATSSAPESSPEPGRRTSLLYPSAGKVATSTSSLERLPAPSPTRKQRTTTSILHPSAARESSVEPISGQPDDTEDDLDDEEWIIENIIAHHMSDPRTHPQELGKEPVMLYQVKWEGFDKPTWEPIESFGDPSIVTEYRKRAGLPTDSSEETEESDEDTTMHASSGKVAVHPPSAQNTEDEEDVPLDQDEYEVEAIVSHHLSDPRTHPPQLGKKPVMLYKVKWKGWDDLTWEPVSSFDDPSVLQDYHRRAGAKTARLDADGDHEMGL